MAPIVDYTTQGIAHTLGVTSSVLVASGGATPAINTDSTSYYHVSAQAVAITSFTTNLAGNPYDGQVLTVRIGSAGANAIAWGASFEPVGATLPVTTVAGKRITVTFRYDSTTSKWGATGVATEA